ncbi:MAG: tetratricopeptide repeat-containing sensor histidine kinase [Phaeodactylibacter sp.]|nr:tetratricopeptide repeat-containing sensor histidine kinase [Phaeodactylibacter sp.]
MQRLFLCLAFVLAAGVLCASTAARDSLLEMLNNSPPRSVERAKALYALSVLHRENAPDEAIRYGEQLIQLAEDIGSMEYRYWGNMSAGVGQAIKGEDLEQALGFFIHALEIASQSSSTDWKLKQIKARINITGVYWQLRDAELALPYVYSNIRELKALGEQLTLADSYQSLALIHQVQKQYDSSLVYLQQAIEIYEELGETKKRNNALLTTGNSYREAGNPRKSLATLQRALRFAAASQDTALIIELFPNIARAYQQLSQAGQALFFARQGLELSDQKGHLPDRVNARLALYEIFEARRQYDSALFYFKAYSGLKERVLNEEKAKKLQELTVSYQTQQKAREYELLRQQYADINFQKTLLLALSALLLGMTILAFFLIRHLRRQKTELEGLNQEILSVNARLVALMNEKKHMVSLIAHDIRTPLSLIQLNTHALAMHQTLSDEERHQILSEIELATRNIDAASLKIMEVENKSMEKGYIHLEAISLNQALMDAVREFQALARSKSIGLHTDMPDNKQYISADAVLARHIIDNLLSNAIKYSPIGGQVTIKLERARNRQYIRVTDEGPGLSAEEQAHLFQKGQPLGARPTGGEPSRGEGLYLSRLFAQAMGGQITVASEMGHGATFTLEFPAAE